MSTRLLLSACGLVVALAWYGCGDNDHSSSSPPPTVGANPSLTPSSPTPSMTPALTKPAFDWGYPLYSQYQDGKHVGTTLYQQDPTCQNRLTFYSCDLIDAEIDDHEWDQRDRRQRSKKIDHRIGKGARRTIPAQQEADRHGDDNA